MDHRRFGLIALLFLVGCESQREAPGETVFNICLLASEEIKPKDLARIGSAGGEVLGGCFADGASRLYFSIDGKCTDFASSTVSRSTDSVEEELSRCSALVVNSDPDSSQSFILPDSGGFALELHNLAGAGVLPVTYIDSYNSVTCVEAPTARFISVAEKFGLPTSPEAWIQKKQSCSIAAVEFSDGSWPSRERTNGGILTRGAGDHP